MGQVPASLSDVDGKYAFRQVPAAPEGAPVFGHRDGNHGVVDLRLQFGRRNSPGFWGLFSAALEHLHNRGCPCKSCATLGGKNCCSVS